MGGSDLKGVGAGSPSASCDSDTGPLPHLLTQSEAFFPLLLTFFLSLGGFLH